MKIISVKPGLAGSHIVTGSTSVFATRPTPSYTPQGVAVSMLPPAFQRRLENGEQLSPQDLETLQQDAGLKVAL